MKPDCWPLSEPATFTRSIWTPGTVRMNAHGSRELGSLLSSSAVTVVPVPIFLESITGVSASTVTVSATLATLDVKVTFDVDAGVDDHGALRGGEAAEGRPTRV